MSMGHYPETTEAAPQGRPHDWTLLMEAGTNTLYTCARCGLFRLETLNGRFHLVRWGEQFSQCTQFPYQP